MRVCRLSPWRGNVDKLRIRALKVSVRDNGREHALLGIVTHEAVLSHPVAVSTWQCFVVERLTNAAPIAQASFYRASNSAEVDLILELRNGRLGCCDQTLIGTDGLHGLLHSRRRL